MRVRTPCPAALIVGVIAAPMHASAQSSANVILSVARPTQAQADTREQASTPPDDPFAHWTLSATLEGYYEYNRNRPPGRINPFRIYDTRANTFGIQQAGVVLESAPDRKDNRPFGLRLDLQFGQATESTQGSSVNEPRPDAYRHIWQAYGSYAFPGSHGVQVDFGKFASNLGYETNYAKDDDHFSRSLLFTFLPGYHAGLRTQVLLNDRVTLLYMLTNGIQQTEDFNEFKSNQFAAVITPTSSLSWTVNYYFGQEQPDGGEAGGPDGWLRIFDTYATYSPIGPLTIGIDANHTSNQVRSGDAASTLDGIGGYIRYQFMEPVRLALRYEHLDDRGGLLAGVKNVLQELTFTAEHKAADGFLVRGEIRRDSSDVDIFSSRRPSDSLRHAQTTALVGLVWWVGNKKGSW